MLFWLNRMGNKKKKFRLNARQLLDNSLSKASFDSKWTKLTAQLPSRAYPLTSLVISIKYPDKDSYFCSGTSKTCAAKICGPSGG